MVQDKAILTMKNQYKVYMIRLSAPSSMTLNDP